MARQQHPKLLSVLLIGAWLLGSTGGSVARADTETAILEPGSPAEWKQANLPPILSAGDISRYRVIFRLQEEGAWAEADKIIAKLKDRVLMGHVLAQRYLHPTRYRSRYKELKAWLDKYADHPQARRLYKLALRRRPKGWRAPRRPVTGYLTGSGHDGRARNTRALPRKRLSRAQYRKRRALERRMRWYLRKGWTKAVKKLINSAEVRRLYHPVGLDKARARLGAGYFLAGRDEWALSWAGEAARRSGKYLPGAHWTTGLAAWRLKRFALAEHHFAQVARSDYSYAWLKSAGAFWAARAALKARKPAAVNGYLDIASAYPRTFYGLLARRQLGIEVRFNWAPPPLPREALAALTEAPGGRRAVTLLQLGEDHPAERELRLLYGRASPDLARAMLALADRAKLPSLAMRLGNMLVRNGASLYDSTAYPVPTLGFKDSSEVDLALILALIRQESGFNPRAKSHAGARGLMQLMPSTASFVARDRRFRGSKRRALFDPETNLRLGRKYIRMLLGNASVQGDLFRLVAAWNGGPGNLSKWWRKDRHKGDPMLFIESIPLRETRIFIERVIANYWIYRMRFGLSTPTLDAVAAGEWPRYPHFEAPTIELAQDEPGNR